MAQHRTLTGNPTAVVVEDIRPQVSRLAARLPESPLPFTSDPHGFRNRLLSFVELKKSSPSSKRQLTLLASLLLRLDKSDEYEGLLDLVRAAGEYAIPELEEVTTNHLVYGDKQRARIREAATDLLQELNEEEAATAKETAGDE